MNDDKKNSIYLGIKEIILFHRFEKAFAKTHNSDYKITDSSDCLYRQTYLSEANQALVNDCKKGNIVALQRWIDKSCGDEVFYDELYSNRMSMRIIANHIKKHINKTSSILDIACGHGFIDQKLADCGFRNITGIDMNPQRVKFLQPYISKCLCMDIDSMDDSNDYDVILALEVLEHVLDVQKALRKINSLLSASGFFYLSVPNGYMIEHDSHVRIFTVDSLTALLQKMDFTIKAITTLPYLNYENNNDIVCVCQKNI